MRHDENSKYDMSHTPKHDAARSVVIGTRESQLAMWQANYVADALRRLHPHRQFRVLGMTTVGDNVQNVPLSSFSSKGVFTKELDVALLSGHIDLAVHCVKDLPTLLPRGIALAAILERGETQDALVVHAKHWGRDLSTLPKNSIVGTSALRRMATLARRYPHLQCKDIRGNVNTRLAKLDRGEYDALILAATGLQRLGLDHRISVILDRKEFGYAVGQGALAIVCRTGESDMMQLCHGLEHTDTTWQCLAERALLRILEGGCKVPISVQSRIIRNDANGITLELHGMVLSVDGKQCVEASASAVLMDGDLTPNNGVAEDIDYAESESSQSCSAGPASKRRKLEESIPQLPKQRYNSRHERIVSQMLHPERHLHETEISHDSDEKYPHGQEQGHEQALHVETKDHDDDEAQVSELVSGDNAIIGSTAQLGDSTAEKLNDATENVGVLDDTSCEARAVRLGCELGDFLLRGGADAILCKIRQQAAEAEAVRHASDS